MVKKFAFLFLLAGLVFISSKIYYERVQSEHFSSRAINEIEYTQNHYPHRHAFFGDIHILTGWTYDSPAFGNWTGPEEAYMHAKGYPIDHPSGFEVQLKRPLDFIAISDRAEYLGVLISAAQNPDHPLANHPIVKAYASHIHEKKIEAFRELVGSISKKEPIKELQNEAMIQKNWEEAVAIADAHNQPGIFTTFPAFQWSSRGPSGYQSLHRIVIYGSSDQVSKKPLSSFDADYPEELWKWMDQQRNAGAQLLAIVHGPNLSDGLMFSGYDSWGKPVSYQWIEQRERNEPLVEIAQIQGWSETHPRLSPNDEFAHFELSELMLSVDPTKLETLIAKPKGSYIRDGYKEGLRLRDKIGINPYQFGIVSSSDTQNSAAAYSEEGYFGKIGKEDGTPESRLIGEGEILDLFRSWGSAGLAGVWAEKNTRESLFEAMERKETFGTTGPRIVVRLFGGWDFEQAHADAHNFTEIGYQKGVPMGSELPRRTHRSEVPGFLVWAIKDIDGANLDRIQIVKGWSDRGQSFEKVYNVSWSGDREINPKSGLLPTVGNTINLSSATYKNTIGTKELFTFWTDPEFDPALDAFYYARVLEIPTPRWSTYDAVRLGISPRNDIPVSIQEQAWTSPIWYVPEIHIREKSRRDAFTVEDFEKSGGKKLTTEETKKLIEGKTLTIENLVTNEHYEAIYRKDGIRTLRRLSGFATLHPSSPGSSRYAIADGRLHSVWKDGRNFSIQIIEHQGKFYGAANKENGYVNYRFDFR